MNTKSQLPGHNSRRIQYVDMNMYVPTQDGADEAHDPNDLSAHLDPIPFNDLLSNLAHEIEVVIVNPPMRVMRTPSIPSICVEF